MYMHVWGIPHTHPQSWGGKSINPEVFLGNGNNLLVLNPFHGSHLDILLSDGHLKDISTMISSEQAGGNLKIAIRHTEDTPDHLLQHSYNCKWRLKFGYTLIVHEHRLSFYASNLSNHSQSLTLKNLLSLVCNMRNVGYSFISLLTDDNIA